MARIGAWKAESHAAALAHHLALPLAERLARSWALYEAHRESLTEREDDPSPFYARARALGLYRP
jgi:hypothetical protein